MCNINSALFFSAFDNLDFETRETDLQIVALLFCFSHTDCKALPYFFLSYESKDSEKRWAPGQCVCEMVISSDKIDALLHEWSICVWLLRHFLVGKRLK